MVLFLTNTFPTTNAFNTGKFNYQAALQLNERTSLKIIHLRSWKPGRRIVQQKQIGELDVLVFSFPYYPIFQSNTFQGVQLALYYRMFGLILGNEIKKMRLIHSVGASFSGVVGSYLSKKYNIPHIAQCIGTDINFTLPKLKNTFGVKGMEKHVNIFTGNSKESASQVLRIYPNVKSEAIYRGVDLDYFNSLSTTKKTDKTTFTFLGGLSMRRETGKGRDYKGGITLLKAWREIENHNNIKLHFLGVEVTKELVNEVLNKPAKGLNVHVQGIINTQEVKGLLDETDVVIIPSWAEGLPNAGMEALASSCAIIGANVGGIPELLDENGFLFEPGDYKKLQELIMYIASDKAMLKCMKMQSRKIAESKFDSSQFLNQYLRLYEKL